MTSWTPETNRIPCGLLTDEEKAALQACKHGWEAYDLKGWYETSLPFSSGAVIYRAKPAPKRVVTWLHWSEHYWFYIYRTKEGATDAAYHDGGWVKRIECNEDGSDVVVTDVVIPDGKEVKK